MGSGGKEKSNGRNRSGSILSGRSRSGSILAEGNGRQRGQSVSKVVEQDAMGGGSSPKPSSPKPGIFSSVSFTSRKRGNSKSSVTDHYTNSEDYNSNNTTSPSRGYINPRAEKYLQEVFVVPGTAVSPPTTTFIPPNAPAGPARKVSSVATPTFATHFESDFGHEEAEQSMDRSSPPPSDDLIAWDEGRHQNRPRGNSSPMFPSEQLYSSNGSYSDQRSDSPARGRDTSSYGDDDDDQSVPSGAMSIPRPAFSSSHSSSGSFNSLSMSSSPNQSKKKSRPFASFVRSSSFVNTPNSPNHTPSALTPNKHLGASEYFDMPSTTSSPPPSSTMPLAEEDWSSLGTKTRIGLGRTRSGSGSQLLNVTNASELINEPEDEREDEVASRMEKLRIAPKEGLGLDASQLRALGFQGRGIALFDFKSTQVCTRLLHSCCSSFTSAHSFLQTELIC